MWKRKTIRKEVATYVNPTCQYSINTNQHDSINIIKTSFDLPGDIAETFVDIFDGFVHDVYNSSGVASKGGLRRVGNDLYYYYTAYSRFRITEFITTGNTSGRMMLENEFWGTTFNRTDTYSGNKTVNYTYYDLKDYVTANKPNAFPDNGVKGGYYYELLGAAPTATAYGITMALMEDIKDDAITEVQQEVLNYYG